MCKIRTLKGYAVFRDKDNNTLYIHQEDLNERDSEDLFHKGFQRTYAFTPEELALIQTEEE